MNRAERRAVLSYARRRASWEWIAGPSMPWAAWGRELPSWRNDLYSVMRYERDTEIGVVTHLVIRNQDGGRDLPWADVQRIKNELAGTERTAVQVFPPVSELVDQANMYHLWVLPEGQLMPFTLT